MRARNIKPALFKNELLGQADPLNTLIFIGCWCAADRDGRLEDRPARLAVELSPYRKFDIEAVLAWLKDNGFIDRYTVAGVAIIQVLKFSEHQRPHANEVPSVLPAKVESTSRQGRKRAHPGNGKGAKGVALIPSCPDTSSLNADTGKRIPNSPHTALPPLTEIEISKRWKAILSAYPKGQARHGVATAKKQATKLVAEGRTDWLRLEMNVRAYATCCYLTERKVMDIRTFFTAEDEPWRNTWQNETPIDQEPAESHAQH
jgi:hypothetical protein